MTKETLTEIYNRIENLERAASRGGASSAPDAILLLCRIFMEYIKLEMEQHGQELK